MCFHIGKYKYLQNFYYRIDLINKPSFSYAKLIFKFQFVCMCDELTHTQGCTITSLDKTNTGKQMPGKDSLLNVCQEKAGIFARFISCKIYKYLFSRHSRRFGFGNIVCSTMGVDLFCVFEQARGKVRSFCPQGPGFVSRRSPMALSYIKDPGL